MPAIQQASEITSDSSGREQSGCVFGTGLITKDGVIELYRLGEDGNTDVKPLCRVLISRVLQGRSLSWRAILVQVSWRMP